MALAWFDSGDVYASGLAGYFVYRSAAVFETKEQATTQAADSMASCVTSTLAAEGKTVAALVCPSEDESLVYAGCDTQAFRERHPERNFIFTLFSDHGMNFTPNPPEHLVDLDEVMEQVGVRVVDSLHDRQPQDELAAIPILHSRVTYVGLHTLPEQASSVSALLSGCSIIRGGNARLNTEWVRRDRHH